MNILFVIVVLAIIFLYIQSYYKSPQVTQIIQTSLSSFHPDLLLEKQPIYVYDQVYNPVDVIVSILKYQYISKILSLSNHVYIKKNLSKFVIIYNDCEEDVNVSLSNPNSLKKEDYYKGVFVDKYYRVMKNNDIVFDIDVILKPYNMIVLPLNWIYRVHQDNLLEIHLFDSLSRICSFL